jgi:hypothetical protein
LCSSPVGESAGAEANNFLPIENWKLKTLMLPDSIIETSTIFELICLSLGTKCLKSAGQEKTSLNSNVKRMRQKRN